MKYDSITEIDIHGMRPEEAVKTLTKLINGAPDTVYRILRSVEQSEEDQDEEVDNGEDKNRLKMGRT